MFFFFFFFTCVVIVVFVTNKKKKKKKKKKKGMTKKCLFTVLQLNAGEKILTIEFLFVIVLATTG